MSYYDISNRLNLILNNKGLKSLNWKPYYYDYELDTLSHSHLIKELSSCDFSSVSEAYIYMDTFSQNNIQYVFNKQKIQIWIPLSQLNPKLIFINYGDNIKK